MAITASGTARRSLGSALVASARPRQWLKNLLVFAAPATGRVLLQPEVFARVFATFVAFTLVSSGVYYVNDIIDRHEDAQHPRKRFRPIAAGEIPVRLAWFVGILLLLGGVLAAFATGGAGLVAVVGGYVILAMSYAIVLRGVALLDMAGIAGGFLLRAVAGGVAVDVPLSSWFLIVATFASLFVAASKRHAELVRVGEARGDHRSTLAGYSESYLRFVQYSSSTACITAYCLWAFEGAVMAPLWSGLSIIPFVLGVFRYALLVDTGRGESPEDLVFGDASLVGFGFTWIALLAVGLLLS
ncbi:MAG: decaprenyl-phosphate phosphoribosyltransferase [Actinomycetota bacterium]|nr:decaprenyl-phosphate phosphoribosyltransferase [Actinomycetota bacterium]